MSPSRPCGLLTLVRATLVAIGLAVLALVLLAPAGSVFADGPNDAEAIAVADNAGFIITPVLVTIITGLLLPFLVAAVTKASSSSTFKAVVGIILAALSAMIARATQTDGSAVFSQGLAIDILLVYGPQLLTYLGLWSKVDINGKIAPSKGLG